MKLGLHGREKEKETVQACVERLESCHQLLLIAGESGTGKTELAKSVQKTKKFAERGMFLLGKFHQAKTGQEPYAAFVTVFQHFVGCLLTLNDHTKGEDRFKALQAELPSELGPLEWGSLMQPFPDLRELLHSEDEKEEAEPSSTERLASIFLPDPDQEFKVRMDSNTPERDKSRFHNSFRKLMRVISDNFSPLVLILDALQWADLLPSTWYEEYNMLADAFYLLSHSTYLPLLNPILSFLCDDSIHS